MLVVLVNLLGLFFLVGTKWVGRICVIFTLVCGEPQMILRSYQLAYCGMACVCQNGVSEAWSRVRLVGCSSARGDRCPFPTELCWSKTLAPYKQAMLFGLVSLKTNKDSDFFVHLFLNVFSLYYVKHLLSLFQPPKVLLGILQKMFQEQPI